jgi:hypothetical protein
MTLNETGGDATSWSWSSDGIAVFSSSTAQNPSISNFANGEVFTVVVTDANGCTASDQTTITVNPLPVVTLILGTDEACEDETSVALTGGSPAGGTYSGMGVFGSIFNPSLVGPGVYTITYTFVDGNGCSASATDNIEVFEVPPAPVTIDINCDLGPGMAVVEVTSPLSPDYEYQLDGGTPQSSPVFTNVSQGQHTITVTNVVTGCFTVGTPFDVDCTCVDPTTLSLSAASGSTCVSTPRTVSGNTFGGSATEVTLSHNGAGSLVPTTTTTSPFSFTYTPAPADVGTMVTITVTTNNPLGLPCTPSTATYVLTINGLPTAVASNSGAVCYDDTNITLSESGGDAVNWSWSSDGAATFNNASAQNPIISGFVDGELFTVTVTDGNGCTSTAQTAVTVFSEPTATASNSGPVCYDVSTITLDETGGDATSWSWSTNGSATITNTTDKSPSVTGFVDGEVFTVVITDANGCTSSAQTTITVYPEPTASASNSGPVCYDETSFTLNETGGDATTWSWSSDGSATITNTGDQNPTVTGFVDGEIFTVVITDANGCTSSDQTTITIDGEPTATANNNDQYAMM